MNITAEEANLLLPEINSEAQLRDLVDAISVNSPGSVTILFSGPAGVYSGPGGEDLQSVRIVRSMIENGEDIRVVNRSEVAKFLDVSADSPARNDILLDTLAKLFGDRPSDPNSRSAAFLYGEVVDGVRLPNGVWDAVSARFVDETVGEIRTITGGASAGRSFAQTEVPQILLSQTITHVDGIPIEHLRDMGPEKAFQAISAQSEVLSAELKIGVDELGKPLLNNGYLQVDARGFFASNPSFVAQRPAENVTMRSMGDFIPMERIEAHAEGLSELRGLRSQLLDQMNSLQLPEQSIQRLSVSKALDRLGVAADVADLALVAFQAKNAYDKGDTETAKSLLLQWAASAACGYLAGELASLAFAPLASAGPAGVIILTAITISASMAGSEQGDDLARWIQGILRTWNDPLQDHFREITFQPPGSPLILDLDGDGVESTSRLDEIIYFDHNHDGLAERTGWVGTDDALLVLDRDHDGLITSGAELFGNNTTGVDGKAAANGFEALAAYDNTGDGQISAADPIWSELRLWRDLDRDGLADEGELQTLDAIGIQAINLDYAISTHYDLQGNQHRQIGSYRKTSGEISAITDVWFSLDPVRSRMVEPVAVSAEIATLPQLDCIGGLVSLHQAMASDASGEIQRRLRAWMAGTVDERNANIDALIYSWAGLKTEQAANSDIPELEDQQLALFLKATGRQQLENQGQSGTLLAVQVKDFYRQFRDQVEMHLVSQVDLLPILGQISMEWNSQSKQFQLSASGLIPWFERQLILGMDTNKLPLVSHFLEQFWPSQPLAVLHQAFVDAAMKASAPVRQAMLQLTASKSWLGGESADRMGGLATADLMIGGDGDDYLQGYGGNDILWGGAGADRLEGGGGDDRYLFDRGDGSDLIACDYDIRTNKKDILIFGSSISPLDIKASAIREGNDVVLQIVGTSDQIVIEEFFEDDQDSINKCQVQTIQFSDGTIWREAEIRQKLPQASAGDDILRGSIHGDLIRGGAGQDLIFGGDGDDRLFGDLGQDTLDGGSGSDVFGFAKGWGQDNIRNTDNDIQSVDIIAFEEGITPGAIDLTRSGANLVLTLKGTKDRLTAIDFFEADGFAPNSWDGVKFSDGTFWDVRNIRERVLAGRSTSQTLIGYATDDVIHAGGGNDFVWGMDGNDSLFGEAGNDWLAGYAGNDYLSGGKGNDEYYYLVGDGADVILSDYDTSKTKHNRIQFGYSVAPSELVPRLLGPDLLLGFQSPWSAGDQILIKDFLRDGDPANAYNPIQEIVFQSGTTWQLDAIISHIVNGVIGTGAQDTLVGLIGSECASGLAGDDTLVASSGDDWLHGGEGSDTLTFDQFEGPIRINLSITTPQDTGDAGVDTILAIENVTGGEGDDRLVGNALANILDGGAGNDEIDGGAGDDILIGGDHGETGDTVSYATAKAAVKVDLTFTGPQNTGGGGHDAITGFENILGSQFSDNLIGNEISNRMAGGAGHDTLRGGLGRDWLTGGEGRDRFVFFDIAEAGLGPDQRDVILDFETGDRIDLSRIDAHDLKPNNQAFVFIGAAPFTGLGQLRYATTGGVGLVQGNCSGGLEADFELELLHAPDLQAASFVL